LLEVGTFFNEVEPAGFGPLLDLSCTDFERGGAGKFWRVGAARPIQLARNVVRFSFGILVRPWGAFVSTLGRRVVNGCTHDGRCARGHRVDECAVRRLPCLLANGEILVATTVIDVLAAVGT